MKSNYVLIRLPIFWDNWDFCVEKRSVLPLMKAKLPVGGRQPDFIAGVFLTPKVLQGSTDDQIKINLGAKKFYLSLLKRVKFHSNNI